MLYSLQQSLAPPPPHMIWHHSAVTTETRAPLQTADSQAGELLLWYWKTADKAQFETALGRMLHTCAFTQVCECVMKHVFIVCILCVLKSVCPAWSEREHVLARGFSKSDMCIALWLTGCSFCFVYSCRLVQDFYTPDSFSVCAL